MTARNHQAQDPGALVDLAFQALLVVQVVLGFPEVPDTQTSLSGLENQEVRVKQPLAPALEMWYRGHKPSDNFLAFHNDFLRCQLLLL